MLPTNRVIFSHPGRILNREWFEPLDINKKAFAILFRISENDLQDFLDGKLSCSPKMAEGLARTLGTTKEFWLNLQENYNKRVGRETLLKALIPKT